MLGLVQENGRNFKHDGAKIDSTPNIKLSREELWLERKHVTFAGNATAASSFGLDFFLYTQ